MADWYTALEGVGRRVQETVKASLVTVQESIADLAPGPLQSAPVPIPQPPSPGLIDRTVRSVDEHKLALLVACCAGAGIGGYYLYKHKKKRRAPRTANASRKEVVVVADYTHGLARSLALDLERRGFIVFCLCANPQERKQIEQEGRADLRPLVVDSAAGLAPSLEHFSAFLALPAPAFHGGHTLHFAGLILGPAQASAGPLELLAPGQAEHVLQTALVRPLDLLQGFLPLAREHKARILVLTDWLVPSLHAPFHIPQTAAAHALAATARSLRREVPTLKTIHLKLGTFDLAHKGNGASVRRVRGSPVKQLHHAVFDALMDRWPATTVCVGSGVRTYETLAHLLPESVLRRLLESRPL
ncbi:hypothetical protein BCR37DRAFT_393894 [Protomyces lactucae-debilis]|uniref:DUF1776-domain-containing protein n=1 Tax=Protomyces lactucae-debilis TaxID=2754530 RepID=A0A1Y2F7B2_PROLT|nr:uncharacterized protein BCR37DRAFT_393894 [Protomyces lactucae-debilis]ORY79810.1 hypothetical protein BCR37DRAFT_393894 [Protomyces lactucae-debilis]